MIIILCKRTDAIQYDFQVIYFCRCLNDSDEMLISHRLTYKHTRQNDCYIIQYYI